MNEQTKQRLLAETYRCRMFRCLNYAAWFSANGDEESAQDQREMAEVYRRRMESLSI